MQSEMRAHPPPSLTSERSNPFLLFFLQKSTNASENQLKGMRENCNNFESQKSFCMLTANDCYSTCSPSASSIIHSSATAGPAVHVSLACSQRKDWVHEYSLVVMPVTAGLVSLPLHVPVQLHLLTSCGTGLKAEAACITLLTLSSSRLKLVRLVTEKIIIMLSFVGDNSIPVLAASVAAIGLVCIP